MRFTGTIRPFWRKWEIYILLGIIAASVAFIVFAYGGRVADEREFSKINECIARRKQSVLCAETAIGELLTRHTAGEVMVQLEKRLDPIVCHTIAHNVGKITYRKYGNTEPALDECNSLCNMGCSHGAIGEALIVEAGIDQNEYDPEHLNPEDIRRVGKKLCGSTAACHGVGHALYQSYQEFEPALALCTEISTGREKIRCYRGVFMEYVDALSIGGFRESHIEKPDSLHPEKVCNQAKLVERQACFRYFARITLDDLLVSGMSSSESNMALFNACKTLPSGDRQACIAGMGVNNTIKIFSDPAAAQEVCRDFPEAADRQACTLGMVSSGIEYDHLPDVLSYCAGIAEESTKASCYQNTFFSLNFAGYMEEPESRMLCKDELCRKGAERYAEDPWMKDSS